MTSSAAVPLKEPTARGLSCAKTLLNALRDTELRPEVFHIVGVGDAELSMDFALLAKNLPAGARVFLIGPGAGGLTREELLGPEDRDGLQVYLFPQTYQRFMATNTTAEAPEFVALFHPGLDIHYFSWYPCLRFWARARVPVMTTAYKIPGTNAERPETVQKILETLMGTGGGAGMWVADAENDFRADDGAFNAGYFVTLGSMGELPKSPDEMYVSLLMALKELSFPFAPRVGYVAYSDSDTGFEVAQASPNLLAAIAEGAMRGARTADDIGEAEARDFAVMVIDLALGTGAGAAWQKSDHKRKICKECGEGYDDYETHQSVCSARLPPFFD